MYIFIDESGTFQIPQRQHQVSCVAALMVPESLLLMLCRKYRKVLSPWRTGGLEIKGSRLSEAQMAEVIRIARRFDIILVSVAIDMGLHSEAVITRHKRQQHDKLLGAIAAETLPIRREWIQTLAVLAIPREQVLDSMRGCDGYVERVNCGPCGQSTTPNQRLGDFNRVFGNVELRNSFEGEQSPL